MKIVKEDITKVGSALEKALSYEISDANAIMSAITEYTTNSKGKLVGELWEKEMNVLNGYLPYLERRKVIANELLNAMRKANDIMTNYVDNFPWDSDKCDTALIEELEARIAKLRQDVERLLAQSRATGVAVDVSGLMAQINKFQEIVDYLKEMPPTDANAYANLNTVNDAIIGMQHKTNGIPVSNI